jgi:hypothetical protein
MKSVKYIFVILCVLSNFNTAVMAESIKVPAPVGAYDILPYRWFFLSGGFKDAESLEIMTSYINTAAEHKLNGAVLSCGLDAILTWDKSRIENLKKLKATCDKKGVELIPLCLSAGYGYGVLKQNPNLAAGMLVKDILFEAKGGMANIVPDVLVSAEDGRFENVDGHRVSLFAMQDDPGGATMIDKRVFKDGGASFRFSFSKRERVAINLTKPYKYYVISFWARGAGSDKIKLELCVYDGNKQRLALPIVFKDGADWQKFEIPVFTMGGPSRLFLGNWSQKAGWVWIDILEVKEPGLLNVLRRPGTPITVRAEKGNMVYKEDVDYARIEDPKLSYTGQVHPAPAIKLLPGGAIKDGDKLLVSFYAPSRLRKNQPVLCMSEPEVYDIWRRTVKAINDAIKPKTWFLDMDEIRGGGTCHLCQSRIKPNGLPITGGDIVGDCITKQVEMIRDVVPDAEVLIWNDMLDPEMNAKPYYHGVPYGYSGSWNKVPKDLIIVPWYLGKAEKSLAHFKKLGFRMIAGAYYDTGNLDGTRTWRWRMSVTPGGIGIMYTTWEHDYSLLGEFGDLVAKPRKTEADRLAEEAAVE